MKTLSIITLTILLLLSINSGIAQSYKVAKASVPNYYKALNSDNHGMVESAIENLVKLKLFAPDLDYSKVAEKLDQLTEDGQTIQIKYKAFVANLYLESPEKFNWISSEDKDKQAKLFDTMFVQLEIRAKNRAQ
jgi:hypothetical protein